MAERFVRALERRPRDVSRRLSPAWVPLQRALGIERAVSVVAGAATRSALDEVGTTGAVIGSTMFLPSTPDEPGDHGADVIAHELVHVAARSDRPRFFHGPLDDEEQRARALERRVGRRPQAPGPPSASRSRPRQGLPGRTARDLDLVPIAELATARVMAVVSAPSLGTGGTGGITAAASAPSLGTTMSWSAPGHHGHGHGDGHGSQRQGSHDHSGPAGPGPGPVGAAPAMPRTSTGAAPSIQRATTSAATSSAGAAGSSGGAPPVAGNGSAGRPAVATSTARLDWFDDLVIALEDRILAEVERRGGRFRGEF